MALTIRPTPEEEKLIKKLKKQFNEKSSSKVLMKAVAEVFLLHTQIIQLNNKIEQLNIINDRLTEQLYKCEQVLNQERTITDQLVILRKERKKLLDDLQSFFNTGGSGSG